MRRRLPRDHADAVRGAQGDVAAHHRLGALAGGLERNRVQDRAQHYAHLHLRERRADAAPRPTAERKPGVGLGRALGEALGAKGEGVGIRGGVAGEKRILRENGIKAFSMFDIDR